MEMDHSDGFGKERLKWSQQLHDLFEKAVDQLGGPDRATPKGILKTMEITGLTIYHVKSHLQKYRMSKFIPESSKGNRIQKHSLPEMIPNFSKISAFRLNEALEMQLEVERRLNDQLEVQKNLKRKMEAQSRFMERITNDYKTRPIAAKAHKPISYTSLFQVSDLETDSEVDQEPPPRKRARVVVVDDIFKVNSQTIILPKGMNRFRPQNNIFPWSLASPLIHASHNSFD